MCPNVPGMGIMNDIGRAMEDKLSKFVKDFAEKIDFEDLAGEVTKRLVSNAANRILETSTVANKFYLFVQNYSNKVIPTDAAEFERFFEDGMEPEFKEEVRKAFSEMVKRTLLEKRTHNYYSGCDHNFPKTIMSQYVETVVMGVIQQQMQIAIDNVKAEAESAKKSIKRSVSAAKKEIK